MHGHDRNSTAATLKTSQDAPGLVVTGTLEGEAGLCTAYCEHAKVEDEQLIQKYSDDITGLLTFAGLLSAIITAFLLGEQVDFQISSPATTNILLYQMLLQQGYSAASGPLRQLPEGLFDSKESDLETHAVILYTISLSLSLLSAFGGLASKQWIMHYGYLPPWADNNVRKARLRRMRHQGLKSWGFYIIMGAIPLLIQASLLLFGFGALLASRQGGVVRIVVLTSIAAGFFFWAITLLLGTLIPSSPFKSPTSQGLFRVLFCTKNIHLYAYRFGNWVASTLGFLRRYRILHARRQLLENWSASRRIWGEESCLVDESISAGIRWWGLRQGLVWGPTPSLMNRHEELARLRRKGTNPQKGENQKHEHLAKYHARMVKKIVGHDPLLLDWGSKVLERADSPSDYPRNALKGQVELLCNFIYYVPAAAPFLLDAALCRAIRHSQGVKEHEPLHISKMSETTTATYFRGLLCAGLASPKMPLNMLTGLIVTIAMPFKHVLGATPGKNKPQVNPSNQTTVGSPTESHHTIPEPPITLDFISARLGIPEHTETHDGWIHGNGRTALCKEICTFLDKYRFEPSTTEDKLLEKMVEDITPAIALASIVVAGDEREAGQPSGSAFERGKLAQCKPYLQLSGAWQLLSKVVPEKLREDSIHELLCNLMLACISVSAAVLCNQTVQDRFGRTAGLENDHFLKCLHILSQLSMPEQGEEESPLQHGVASLLQRLSERAHLSEQFKDQLHNLLQLEHLKPNTAGDARGADSEAQEPTETGITQGVRRYLPLQVQTQGLSSRNGFSPGEGHLGDASV